MREREREKEDAKAKMDERIMIHNAYTQLEQDEPINLRLNNSSDF